MLLVKLVPWTGRNTTRMLVLVGGRLLLESQGSFLVQLVTCRGEGPPWRPPVLPVTPGRMRGWALGCISCDLGVTRQRLPGEVACVGDKLEGSGRFWTWSHPAKAQKAPSCLSWAPGQNCSPRCSVKLIQHWRGWSVWLWEPAGHTARAHGLGTNWACCGGWSGTQEGLGGIGAAGGLR